MLCCGVLARLTGFVLVSGLIHLIESYPFGAGLSACRTLIPGHGKESQPMTTLPFMLEPESDYFTVGRVFKVRIRTVSGKFKNRKIGGFFVQARAPGTTDPVGRWEVHHEEAIKYGMKAQNCSYAFDSITHSDSKPKNADLVIHFMPTADTPDQIQFMGTIARDYGTFWANVKSTIVTKRLVSANEVLQETTVAPIKFHGQFEEEPVTVAAATSATTRRTHHVTHNMPEHVRHNIHKPSVQVNVHHRDRTPHHRRTTMRPMTTTTLLPMAPEVLVTGSGDLVVKVDLEEKYREDKEVAKLVEKNELASEKRRDGQKDDEADRVQNDGNTNPDSQSVKLGRASGAASSRRDWTAMTLLSGIITYLTIFMSSWMLRV